MATINQTPSRVLVENFGQAPSDWEDCNICFELKDEELRGHTAGSAVHQYHQSCLNNWLERNSSCPDCRQPLASREIQVRSTEQAMIELEFNFPGILNAPKEFLEQAIEHLKISAPLSAALVLLNAIVSKTLPLEPAHVVSGALIGFASSHVIRRFTNEAPVALNLESSLDQVQQAVNSRSFMGSIIGSAALGAVISSGTFLFSSVPIIIAGIGAKYALDQLHENNYISEREKDMAQTATTIVTSALSLMSPIKAVVSLTLGAAFGAAVEANRTPREVAAE